MANIITFVRVVCSVALLFCPALSTPFYVLYLTAGFSDMIDGPVARATGTASEFGSKFDTVADFILVVVCLIKLIPVLDIPLWLIIWIAFIALIKMSNIISGYVMHKKLVAAHTVMNKVNAPTTQKMLESRVEFMRKMFGEKMNKRLSGYPVKMSLDGI